MMPAYFEQVVSEGKFAMNDNHNAQGKGKGINTKLASAT
jgi:hypothetical protein